MNQSSTSAIFLLTGLMTAAGANQQHPTLKLAKSLVEEEQYIVAIYTAEKIIEHYPRTFYAEEAKKLIEVVKESYLDHRQRCN